ncbi:uncharacterized protein Z518_03231 [Rhinocladiella mackenziei CBS 650.93]|uniref:Uncharacterized protein n=1 Tax=Rhinocladiella mackenziei CBS 650.93 TaxID=1442369 RepID=A0A0D2JGW9_9EURO|nr:uncharacterized protein Z518_03231 [Rhinocladiella mackenziei CBS 650.93]KIX08575.1 hypothetical protein Z518_03231 [Rhinocladiella mackenziei CBS 650.93]
MSNPKAKQTCFGIHSIPCYRYHQTMHAIGTSHNCFSCIQADELHDNRHRRIAELLVEYKISTGADPAKLRAGLEELPVNVPRAATAAVTAGPAAQNDMIAQQEEEIRDEDNEDAQTTTSASSETVVAAVPHKLTKAEARAMKKAAKAAKSQFKASKNQKKHAIIVRTEDVDFVNKILHGDMAHQSASSHPLASDKTIEEVIQRNMGFIASIEDHKKQLLSTIAQRRRSDRERRKSAAAYHGHGKRRRFIDSSHVEEGEDEYDEADKLVMAALTKLGVAANIVGTKKVAGGVASSGVGGSGVSTQASIVANLKALVKDDLERFENEQRETCVRAGGFWRYAGRTVFDRMTKIAEELDWRTGMKLKGED